MPFDRDLARRARSEGVLPPGGKLAKISTAGIAHLRRIAGEHFTLWDGSARRIQASLDAGATGVVAGPLCAFREDMPLLGVPSIQAAVDRVYRDLDALPDRDARTAELRRRAREGLPGA